MKVIEDDSYLDQFNGDLKLRHKEFQKWLQTFKDAEGGLLEIGRGYKKYGLNLQPNGDLTFKEWAPNAKCMKFFGDFN